MRVLVAALIVLSITIASPAVAQSGPQLTGADATIWNGLSHTTWIAQGNGNRIIYAYIDPNCPISQALYSKSQKLINPSVAQIRWIPVGVLPRVTQNSRQKAAAALKGNLSELNTVMHGREPSGYGSTTQLKEVDRNASFLNEIEKYVPPGVPKFIYVKDSGNEVRVFTGLPQQAELEKELR